MIREHPGSPWSPDVNGARPLGLDGKAAFFGLDYLTQLDYKDTFNLCK